MKKQMVEDTKFTYENYADDSGAIPVQVIEKPKRKNDNVANDLQSSISNLLGQERFWAALAHLMGPMIVFLVLTTEGVNWMGPILITAGILLYYSNRSEMVKFHAREALAAQLLGTFGWMALLLSGTAIWVVMIILSALLILVLIGIILLPLVALAYPIFALASFVLPISMVLFGAIGAWESWHGRSYRYPYLADWLDRKFGVVKTKEVIIA